MAVIGGLAGAGGAMDEVVESVEHFWMNNMVRGYLNYGVFVGVETD